MVTSPQQESRSHATLADADLGWRERTTARALEAARRSSLDKSTQFVKAARELLAEKGGLDFTVQDVVRRSGLSLRSFYQRFASKEGLHLAVLEESMCGAAESQARAMDSVRSPLRRLRRLVIGLFDAANGTPGQAAALARETLRLAETRPAELRHAMSPVIGLLASEIGEAITAGEVRRDDPAKLAVMVHHVIQAHIHATLLGLASEGAARISAEDAWDFCRRALLP